jgi:patatin-like phospholipase/acyl hydrolase
MTDNASLLEKRFDINGPKRILAMDGGGIRGALTLGFLKKIETELKSRHQHLYKNADEFRLCHYFDLIGGTSTGAIIATAMAIGMSVDEISKLYQDVGGKIFNKKYKWKFWKRWWVDYSHKPMEAALQTAYSKNGKPILFNDQGADGVQTGLCIVIQRADTFSMWPLSNNPKATYYKSNNYPLWELVRCSSAAPTFFEPHFMKILDKQGNPTKDGVFIDGGLSMMNNPALQLFLNSTLDAYKFNWETGADKLLIVSVGTGYQKRNEDLLKVANRSKLGWAKNIPDMFMDASTWQNQLFMQWFGESKNSFMINREVGTLADEKLMKGNKFFTYVRYNTKLEAKALKDELGFTFTEEEVEFLRKMDKGENRFKLNEIGMKSAEIQFKPEHIPEGFNLQQIQI